MHTLDKYLSRQQVIHNLISEPPTPNLTYAVVIPVYNEPTFISTLDSIAEADAPKGGVEIIALINSAESSSKSIISQNRETEGSIRVWQKEYPSITVHPVRVEDIPDKHAGPGYARKLGMDEAIRRFASLNQHNGIIISLDADTTCAKNYFTAIENALTNDPKLNAGTIFFEHPVDGNEFDPPIYRAVAQYELFLRYYKQGLLFCGFPYAFHTIGSAFFVKAPAYAKQGGMNKRKAGEDFYFLNKIFSLGHAKELVGTCVYPSPRPSERVLFGTGPEVKKIATNQEDQIMTYHPDVFSTLKALFNQIDRLYDLSSDTYQAVLTHLPAGLRNFMEKNKAFENISRIRKNCSSSQVFKKHFFQWFDGLKIIRYIHEAHEEYLSKIGINEAASMMLEKSGFSYMENKGAIELLGIYKEIEQGRPVHI